MAEKSLLAGLMAKKTTGVTSNEPKATAPAAERDSPEGSSKTPVVETPRTPQPPKNSLLGALRTQSNKEVTSANAATSPAVAVAKVESKADSAGTPPSGEDTATRESLLDGHKGTGVAVVKSGSILSGLAATRAKAEASKADHDYLFDEVPKDFQDVLNRFDALMHRDQGEIDINLPRMRDYVMRIMVDLKENPEFDGMIIDRDVHNVIAFMRRTKGQAVAIANEKQEKGIRRATNSKKSGAARFAMDLGNLDLGASDSPKKLTSIEDLSNIEF